MADNPVRNIAPFINDRFTVTSRWWKWRVNPVTHVTQLHRGLDIATPRSLGNAPVYSMLDGVVHSLGSDSSRGNWIIIWDNREDSETYGYATLYMHLVATPLVIRGQSVSKGTRIGYEGSTGASTGIHLHVEMQDISRFNNQWHTSTTKSDYLDPTLYMGIDNVEGTWWIYNGEPGPGPEPPVPPSPSSRRKGSFPWVLYSRKRRNL